VLDKVAHLEDAMRAHAQAEFPKEACALLVKKGKKAEFRPCVNSAEKPTLDFRIDSLEYRRVSGEDEVIGIWHSHINRPPAMTPTDLAYCEITAVPWFITSIYLSDGQYVFSGTTVHEPTGCKPDYLQRPYVFGVMDCYSLCRDYLARELSIEIPAYQDCRVPGWASKGYNFFAEKYEEAGFARLPSGSAAEIGDLFLMQIAAGVPDHIGVYVGNDQMLHHPHGRLSQKSVYGGYWEKHTTHHLRHKSRMDHAD